MTDGGIHYTDPFRTPMELREPARRFRGRLTAGVSVWTAAGEEGPAGLTISSLLLADGAPARLFGLITDTAQLFDAIVRSGRFVVHVLPSSARRVAEMFAGTFPAPGGPFAHVDTQDSEWGPVLKGPGDRAYCRLVHLEDAGYQRLVAAEVEKIELSDLAEPLVYFRGRYRALHAAAATEED